MYIYLVKTNSLTFILDPSTRRPRIFEMNGGKGWVSNQDSDEESDIVEGGWGWNVEGLK